MRSLSIALCVVLVFAETSLDELKRFRIVPRSEIADVPDVDMPSSSDTVGDQEMIDDRRRIWKWIKSGVSTTVNSVVDGVVDVGSAVVEGTVDIGATVVNGVVDLGQDILEFTIGLIGPNGFSEKLAREWLNIRLAGNVKVEDVLQSGLSVMNSYKNQQCSVLKHSVLPVLRGKIKGENDGVLYVGYGSSGGLGWGQGKTTGVFVDHNGFEGCFETICTQVGLHAGGGVGATAGYLHGEGTNDMPGDSTGGGVSFDVGPGIDVVGGFTSGGKGFVEIGSGKGVGLNLGSHFECNTKTWSTNAHTCTVTLYQHDHFGGSSKSYGTGSVPLVWWNDEVSSIKVKGHGCEATVYEHGNYEGWSVRLSQGHYTLSALRNKGFKNDHMSSMKVFKSRRRTELLADRLAGLN